MKIVGLLRQDSIVGWHRNLSLPDCLDFAFRNRKVSIFVDGDFWHEIPATIRDSKTRTEFFNQKITRNSHRDTLGTQAPVSRGEILLRFGDLELKKTSESCVVGILATLSNPLSGDKNVVKKGASV